MIKIILFDIDGVIIRPPHYFWKKLEDEWYKNAEEILNNFFTHENTSCTEGKADIKKTIPPYLEQIWWKQSVDDFLTQQFEFESQFYDEVFQTLVEEFQEIGIICYLASAQEEVRAEYFLDTFGLGNIFNGSYISFDVWFRKDAPQYWEVVLWDIALRHPDVSVEEILFIDDGKKNIEVAEWFGIHTIHFKDMQQFENDLAAYV